MWTSNVREILTRPKVQITACSVLSAAVGSAVTYVTLSKRVDAKYQELANAEIEEAKAFYKSQIKPEMPPKYSFDPAQPLVTGTDVEDAIEHLTTYGGHVLQPIEAVPEGQPDKWIEEARREALEKEPIIERNIFTDPIPDIPEHMINERDDEHPFPIHETEFFDNAPDNIQDSYTYYEGDDTLADRNDQEVTENRVELLGADGLDRWGYGSNDVNMVYIRNPKRGLDIEITRSTGKYAEEVGGFMGDEGDEAELKHSADFYRRREFRRGDR